MSHPRTLETANNELLETVCGYEVADRLFDKSPEANAYLENAVIDGGGVRLDCVRCGHCVVRTMVQSPDDANRCLTY